jgi:hypothetical protein
MTNGTSANTYRLSPDRRSKTAPISKGPAIQHRGRELIALTAHFSLPQPEITHPPGQDAQINYLDILATFMKQRTYLTTLL